MDEKDYIKITWNDIDDDTYKSKLCENAMIKLHGNICSYESDMATSVVDTESPIEQIIAIGLSSHEELSGFHLYNPFIDVLGIEKQAEIECESKKYRADFLIPVCYRVNGVQHLKQFIIECDGYDYHERTKKQVDARNKRDRLLNRNGYIVLHFSGSEIVKDVNKCIKDIIKTILKGLDEYGGL